MEDDLRNDERDRVQAHVASCEICDRDLSELRDTVALLHGLRDEEAPPQLAAAVMSRIRAGEAEPPRIRRLLSRFADPGTGLALAAGVAGLLVFATLEPIRFEFSGREVASVPVLPPIADYFVPEASGGYRGPSQPVFVQQAVARPGRRVAAFGSGWPIPDSAMPVPWPSPDDLNRLRFNPPAYVVHMNGLAPRERSRALARLVERVVQHNAELEVFYLLRSVDQPGAQRLAKAFEDQAQQVKWVQRAESARVGR
jgi:hypothetical protein